MVRKCGWRPESESSSSCSSPPLVLPPTPPSARSRFQRTSARWPVRLVVPKQLFEPVNIISAPYFPPHPSDFGGVGIIYQCVGSDLVGWAESGCGTEVSIRLD